MRNLIMGTMLAAAILSSCNTDEKSTTSGSTNAADTSMNTESHSGKTSNLDSATTMQNWQNYMSVSDVHKMMATWDGTWEQEVSLWHTPDAPPTVSKGQSVNKMIMDGRYQQSTNTGDMMGQPFKGISTLAYDNAKKKFISTWIDNMGTGIMVMQGPWDETTKSMTLSGEVVDPAAGTGQTIAMKETYKIVDENHHIMEMYGPGPDGKDFKMMEIKFTRK